MSELQQMLEDADESWGKVARLAEGDIEAWNVSKRDLARCLVFLFRAIVTLSWWCVQAQTGLNVKDHEGVVKTAKGIMQTEDKGV